MPTVIAAASALAQHPQRFIPLYVTANIKIA